MLLGIALGALLLTIQPLGAQDTPPTTDPDQARIFNVPENTVDVDTISYTRGDPRDRIIFWTLGGMDAADFTIEGGALKFRNKPDFENPTDRVSTDPADAARNNTYKVTVRFGEGGQDAKPGGDDLYEYDDLTEIEVTVNVRDVDEGGTVVLSPLQPQVETILTATLVEEDFVTPGSGQWQWARHDAPANGSKPAEDSPNWEDIQNLSRDATYRPIPEDQGKYLRVTVQYGDASGPETKTEMAVTDHAVRKDTNTSNDDPKYPDQTTLGSVTAGVTGGDAPRREVTVRYVRETASAGTTVGAPVTAFDDDTDIDLLTYSLVGVDRADFNIHPKTGQLTVSPKANLEADGDSPKLIHTVRVVATDGDADERNIDCGRQCPAA